MKHLQRPDWQQTMVIIFVLTYLSFSSLCAAVEFRVDTRVFQSGHSHPLAKHTTWLGQDRIYNVAKRSSDGQIRKHEVTIFDLQKRTVAIMAPDRQERTLLKFDEILEFIAATTSRTTLLSKVVRFASAPKFEYDWDGKHRRLYLNHPTMAYSSELISPPFNQPESEEHTALYRTFADWAARLNTTCPGLPPAARLKLNLAIYERQAVPKSVRRTIPTGNGTILDVVSRHEYQWSLSPEDHAQLAIYDESESSFRFVDYKQFLDSSSGHADMQQ